jgi:hypothetical protein
MPLEALKDLGRLALTGCHDVGELFEQRLAHTVRSSLGAPRSGPPLCGDSGSTGCVAHGRSDGDYRAPRRSTRKTGSSETTGFWALSPGQRRSLLSDCL